MINNYLRSITDLINYEKLSKKMINYVIFVFY